VIYYFIFAILAFGGSIDILWGKQIKNIANFRLFFFIVTCISLFLFRGLRWNTGTDWNSYYYFFLDVNWSYLLHPNQLEEGFIFLTLVIKSIYNSYTFFLIVLNILIVYFLARGTKQHSKFYLLTFLILFVSKNPFPVRQGLAMSIIILSYKEIINKNFLRYVVYVILATTIHRTSIVFLPFYFVLNKSYSNKFLLLVYSTGVIGGMLPSILLKVINPFLFIFSENKVILKKALFYLQQFDGGLSPTQIITTQLSTGLFIFLFIVFRNKIKHKELPNYDFYLNLAIFGAFFNRLFLMSFKAFSRVDSYFVFGEYMLLTYIIMHLKNRTRLLVLPIVIGYFLLRYYSALNIWSDLYFPYISVFDINKYRLMY